MSTFPALIFDLVYWQIPIHESGKEKTAFATPYGLYEFNVMSFELCNVPTIFECMID